MRCRRATPEKAARRTPAATLEGTGDPIRHEAMALVLLSFQAGGGMSKSRAKKATTRKAALVTAAERSGPQSRPCGRRRRARDLARACAQSRRTPVRKRAQAGRVGAMWASSSASRSSAAASERDRGCERRRAAHRREPRITPVTSGRAYWRRPAAGPRRAAACPACPGASQCGSRRHIGGGQWAAASERTATP